MTSLRNQIAAALRTVDRTCEKQLERLAWEPYRRLAERLGDPIHSVVSAHTSDSVIAGLDAELFARFSDDANFLDAESV